MAAPPTINARRLDKSLAFDFSSWYNPFQIVGTPAATVTFIFSMVSASEAGVRCIDGITISAPTMVHAYGNPQAWAWNWGTTGSTTSEATRPKQLVRLIA